MVYWISRLAILKIIIIIIIKTEISTKQETGFYSGTLS
jgi:hypothetical protein